MSCLTLVRWKFQTIPHLFKFFFFFWQTKARIGVTGEELLVCWLLMSPRRLLQSWLLVSPKSWIPVLKEHCDLCAQPEPSPSKKKYNVCLFRGAARRAPVNTAELAVVAAFVWKPHVSPLLLSFCALV